MHEQDSSIDATPLTSMEAAQEVVADMMGLILKGGGVTANGRAIPSAKCWKRR